MPTSSSLHRQTESRARDDSTAYRGEHLTLRNHDHRSGYELTVVVSRPDGRVLDRQRYVLGADTTKRVFDLGTSSDVRIEVRYAGEPADAATARLDDTPEGTVVVECGNGVVTAVAGVP